MSVNSGQKAVPIVGGTRPHCWSKNNEKVHNRMPFNDGVSDANDQRGTSRNFPGIQDSRRRKSPQNIEKHGKHERKRGWWWFSF
jgi:hypothetical protein